MNPDSHDLIQRHMAGLLTDDEAADLQTRLKADADLRRLYLHYMNLDVALEAQAGSRERVIDLLKAAPLTKNKPAGRWLKWRPIAAAAALALLAAASVWTWLGSRELAVLALVDASGPVAWSEDGKWRTDLAIGEQLKAGSIETVGEATSASFRFRDGTLITLSGDSELSFSENVQKLLVLRKGSLSAQVKPQPKDKPMLVRTSSAEARVVGTVFNLAARTEDTLLKVDEGLVKLKRLADGSTIDVPAKSSAVASLDSGLKLNSTSTPEPLTNWSFDFTRTLPPREWRGISDGTRMVASPYVASRKENGAIITHFGVSVRTAHLMPTLALLATDKSVIRYRLKQDRLAPLQVMLLTSNGKGGYGGNFECKLPANRLRPDAEGWCDVEIPISEFTPADRRPALRQKYRSPNGNILSSVLISSFQQNTKLTVSRFELRSSSKP